jgi:Aldehyde dehydrogenase family
MATKCTVPCLQDDMKIAMEEIFGPVQVILKYKTIEEVLADVLFSSIVYLHSTFALGHTRHVNSTGAGNFARWAN